MLEHTLPKYPDSLLLSQLKAESRKRHLEHNIGCSSQLKVAFGDQGWVMGELF